MNNPIVRILFSLLGAFFLVSFVHRIWSPLGLVVLVLSALTAVLLWVLEYHPNLSHKIYNNPIGGPLVELVCKLTSRQLPIEGGSNYSSVEDTKEDKDAWWLWPDGRLTEVKSKIRARFLGYDNNIDELFGQLRNHALLFNKRTTSDLRPIGLYLFVGNTGLGKKHLAQYIAYYLYGENNLIEINIENAGYSTIETIAKEINLRPKSALILDNLDLADSEFLDELSRIVNGSTATHPETGRQVSFQQCCIFGIVQKEAEVLEEITREGLTTTVDSIARLAGLENYLTLLTCFNTYPFTLPAKMIRPDIIMILMEEECGKYDIELDYIAPQILVHETKFVTENGSFEMMPARIVKKLQKTIENALVNENQTITLDEQSF